MDPRPKLLTRIATALITVIVVLPTTMIIVPERAHAGGWPTYDFLNHVQSLLQTFEQHQGTLYTYVLRPLAIAIARRAIQSILRATINWANNGFNGSPAYATNLKNDMRTLGDQVANRFLRELGLSGGIDSPFRNLVVDRVRVHYRRSTSDNAFFASSRYTLNRYSSDDAAFLRGDFHLGGLRAWVEAWRNPLNNPIGAFNSINSELQARITGAQGNRTLELSWGRGLMSWCREPEGGDNAVGGDGPVDLTPPPTGGSPDCDIETPGSWLHSHIEKALNSNIDQLVSADDLDELVGALLSAFTNKLLGEDGLAGLSQPSSGGGLSYVDELGGNPIGPSGTLSGNFAGVISGQVSQLATFKSNWQILQARAEEAKTVCDEQALADVDYVETVNLVLDEAEAAIARADAGLEALAAIQTKISTGGAQNNTAAVNEGYAEYQALLASNILPTAAELVDAGAQSQELTDADPPSLLTILRVIIEQNCRMSP